MPALLLLSTLAVWPDAALSERGPRLLADPGAVSAAAADDDPNSARVIVQYRSGSTLARLAATAGRAQHAGRLGSRLALPLVDGRPLGPHSQGLRGQGLSSRQLAARLSAQPDVEWAVVDQRRTITAELPNDPFYGANQTSITPTVGQWYLRAPDATTLSAINAEGAWAITTGSSTITVAVIDTGVRFDHPDLAGKLWPGYDFVRSSVSGDGDGQDADASDPGDWTTATNTCGASNSSWHGTQVAGLIGAASDNNLGMAGVGRNVMVLPVRALGKCGGFDSDIQAAMLWAAGLTSSPVVNPHPAKVINLSLGSSGSCGSYQAVVSQLVAAGVTVVVAAGNSAGLAVNSPANCVGAIAVAGLRHAGTKVGYSNLGPQVALAAPAGNCVNETGLCLYPLLTTANAGTTAPGANTYSDSIKSSLGTSFASPLVAGTVALMLSADPTLTPAKIKAALQATVRPFPTTGAQTPGATACAAPSATTQVECYCTTSTCGTGMLDARAAVTSVQVAAAVPPTAFIIVSPSAPTVGMAVTLDGSGSTAAGGRSVTAYQWAITSGATLASFTGAVTGSAATLATLAAGDVVVSLTVTDSAGLTRNLAQTITIAPTQAVVVTPPTSGGGGGAMGWGWMLGLASAILLLARRPRR